MTKRSSRMLGFGHSVPERCVENAEIEARLGLDHGWIERRTGIRRRRWAVAGETLTDFAAAAGSAALDDAGIHRKEIALTILATSTPDHLLPPSAPLLAHRLNLSNSGSIDVAGACTGFLYALALADPYVRVHGQPVLVVAANILSRRINMNERASATVFGDAAGAVVLGPTEHHARGILGIDLTSDGSQYGLIGIAAGGSVRPFGDDVEPHELLMQIRDGPAVFCHAVRMMVQSIERTFKQTGVAAGDIDRFIPHQANARIIAAVCKRLALRDNIVVRTIGEYGNSSAATIPLSLSIANKQCPFAPGERLLLSAAGAGMTGGAIILRH